MHIVSFLSGTSIPPKSQNLVVRAQIWDKKFILYVLFDRKIKETGLFPDPALLQSSWKSWVEGNSRWLLEETSLAR